MFRDSDIGMHNQEEVRPTEQDVVEENVPIGTVTGNNRDRENSKENDVLETRVRANDVSALPAMSDKPSSGNARSSRRGAAAVITGSPYKDSLKMKKKIATTSKFKLMAKKACGKNLASKHKKCRKRKAVSSSSESDQEEPVLTDADNSD
jgi:hypothetical protein